MEKRDMEALLDRVYELEGLLHLALGREDCPARLEEIIRLKGRRIAEIIAAGGEVDGCDVSGGEVAGDEVAGDEVKEEESAPDAEPMLEEEEMMAEAWDEEAAEGPVEGDDSHETHEGLENHERHEHHEPAPVEKTEPVETQRSGHLKSRFSLNDRFRFSRELFGGDTRRFDAVVERLNAAPGFDEARDYLVSDLAWDIEADDLAAEFVEIIKPFF